ncbi:hypothetical protein QBC39DRAFT_384110 [Podospora conica]|nr:hypothetical protein QBC39DRAFT_384110 [Schizothecium conicum]
MPPKRNSDTGGHAPTKKRRAASTSAASLSDDAASAVATTDLEIRYLKAATTLESRIVDIAPPALVEDDWLLERVRESGRVGHPPRHPPRMTENQRRYWTRDDEAQLVQAWQGDPLRMKVEAQSDNMVKAQRSMWKSFGQYFRCTPAELMGDAIVGSRYGLAIDLTGQKKIPPRENASLAYSPFWPTTMCVAMNEIMWHPLWRDGHMINTTDSLFLEDLRTEIQDEKDLVIGERSSVGELCRRVAASKPGRQTSDWFLLFDAIYKQYEGKGIESESTTAVYAVCSDDLTATRAAMDGIGAHGLPSPVNADMYRAVSSYHRGSKTAPKGLNTFREVLDIVALNFKRRQAVHRLVSVATTNAAAAGTSAATTNAAATNAAANVANAGPSNAFAGTSATAASSGTSDAANAVGANTYTAPKDQGPRPSSSVPTNRRMSTRRPIILTSPWEACMNHGKQPNSRCCPLKMTSRWHLSLPHQKRFPLV